MKTYKAAFVSVILLAGCDSKSSSPAPAVSASTSTASAPSSAPAASAAAPPPTIHLPAREGRSRIVELATSCIDYMARDPRGCTWLGLYTDTAAMADLQKECDQKKAASCTLAGYGFTRRNEMVAKAAAMFEKGCTLGDVTACNFLAAGAACVSDPLLPCPEPFQQTPKRKEELAKKAEASCGDSWASGCIAMAVVAGPNASAPWHRKACDLGLMGSCKEVLSAAKNGKDEALIKKTIGTMHALCDAAPITCLELADTEIPTGYDAWLDARKPGDLRQKACEAKSDPMWVAGLCK